LAAIIASIVAKPVQHIVLLIAISLDFAILHELSGECQLMNQQSINNCTTRMSDRCLKALSFTNELSSLFLSGMLVRTSDEKVVCLSVRPSVCQTCAL